MGDVSQKEKRLSLAPLGQVHEFLLALERAGYTTDDLQPFIQRGGALFSASTVNESPESAVWEVVTKLKHVSDLINALKQIVALDIHSEKVGQIDVRHIIELPIDKDIPSSLALLWWSLLRQARMKLLRFRVFENQEDDPANWPLLEDNYTEGFDFELECLHLLGRNYFTPQQEKYIWEEMMVSDDPNGDWNNVEKLACYDFCSGLHNNPWQEQFPDLHESYRVRIFSQVHSLAGLRAVQWRNQSPAVTTPEFKRDVTAVVSWYNKDIHRFTQQTLWVAFVAVNRHNIEQLLFGAKQPFSSANWPKFDYADPERQQLKDIVADILKTETLPAIAIARDEDIPDQGMAARAVVECLQQHFPHLEIPANLLKQAFI